MRVILTFLVISTTLSANKKVTLSTLDWPPYIDQKIKNNGYVGKVVRQAFKVSGRDVEFKFFPWARALALATNGEVDGLVPEYYSTERKKNFIYSDPFPGGPVGFFKRQDRNITFSKLSDLKGYNIGVVRGYINTQNFDNAKYLTKYESVSDEVNLKKLFNQRIDLIFIDKFTAHHLMKHTIKDPKFSNSLHFMEPGLETKDLFIVFPKVNLQRSQMLNRDFSRGLKILKENGTVQALIDQMSK